MKHLKLESIQWLIIGVIILFISSCGDDDATCQDNSPYIEINGDCFAIDRNEKGLVYTTQFRSDLGGYIISVDEFRHTVGGIFINDVIGIFIKMDELKEGVYPLVDNDMNFCENEDDHLEKLSPGQAIAYIQTFNIGNFYNEDAEIRIIKSNDSFIIKGENIIFSEYSCRIELGTNFDASFQLIY